MPRLLLISGLIAIIGSFQCSAQRIDNSSVFKSINSDNYFRLHYDNDYFTRTDKYYTQGIELEYANPAIKNFLLSRLLLKPKHSQSKYGISIDHMAFTPTSTSTNAILYGDRPFAASLTIRLFAITTDSSKRQRISTALVAGILGPGAGGKEMQTTIHRWLNNPLPMGWENQIQNDLILNYQVNFEKELIKVNQLFLLNSAAEIRGGTFNDKISGGFNFMLGNFSDPFRISPSKFKKKLSYYLYGQPRLDLVGYDASLQGGLFDHNNPYTISTKAISRVNFQGDYGIVVYLNRLYLEYCQSYLTKEFASGTYHRWGGIRFGLSW